MKKETACHLWFTQDLKQFFLILDRTVLMPGLDSIYDLQGNHKLVALAALSSYTCSQEEAKDHLYAVWRASLESTKQAWLNLYHFSQRTGNDINIADLSKQFQEGLEIAGLHAQEAFATSQAFVESLFTAAHGQEPLAETEQKALFKRIFSQIPQLLEQLSDANLEAAAQDPDAWAEKLYQQLFAELDKNKHAQRKRELAHDIRASIAKGLRSVGMTPAIDWEKNAPEP